MKYLQARRSMGLKLFLLLALVLLRGGAAAAQLQEPPLRRSRVINSQPNVATATTVAYELGMSRPTTHLFEATMTVTDLTAPHIDVQFPAWVPGAYRIIDAARNVQEFRAATLGGESLPVTKTHTDTWRVETRGNRAVRVSYKVYADNLTVSGMQLDDTHAFFNGPLLFPYVVGAKERPVTLTINKPPQWTAISTGLEPLAGRPNTFTAPDYDTFVDAPVEVGAHNVLRFNHEGALYEVAIYGNHNYDLRRFQSEIEAMVR